jgi:hypothetical protein
MAADIQLKRSSVPGKTPDSANVLVGEPVVNLADKVIYTKDGSGTVIVIGAGTTSNVTEGTNLYFSNARVKTAISSQQLDNASFSGAIFAGGELSLGAIGGDEGGQINLGKPSTNTTLAGNVAIDIYQNKLRIFEGGGDARGVYVDLTTAGAGVSTNLIGAGSGTITSVAGVNSGAVSNAQLVAATVTSQTLTNATFTANVTADRFISNNNGNGENYRIGDDAWVGDYNIANAIRIKGIQDPANAYINFGTGDAATLGRAGTGALTYTGPFTATGNVTTGNVSGTAGTFTFSRLGTVESGTWQGTSISTTYTDAKVISVGGAAGVVSNVQLAAGITSSGVLNTSNVTEGTNLYFTNARVLANITGAGFVNTVSNTAPIGAVKSGTSLTLSHLNSGVAASTYGGQSVVPVFTVDSTGHITAASNVTVVVANSNITGNIIAYQLQPTGVTPATYGSAVNIPAVAVDHQGRITSAANVALSGIKLSAFAATTSAELAGVISDETGSGNLVFSTSPTLSSPTLTTPNIGTASGTALSLTANLVARDVVVQGNLIVSGTQTIINTETIDLADNEIVLNSNHTGAPTQDAGIIVNRGSSANVELFWDETNDRWSVNTGAASFIIHNTGRDVVLGTETSGSYVANLVQGSGISLTNLANEGATPTIALATSGVSAGTYGAAALQAVISVDTFGRITSASNVTTTVSNSNITGNILASQLQPTGVTPTTYGAAAVQAVFTVDHQGRITSASNVTSTVANSNITGNIIASQIQPTGVTASTYGGSSVAPVVVIDQQGRITSAANATITVANSNISGNIIASQLQPTGVTANTYGGTTSVPVIVIDNQGRITSAANASISAGVTSVGGATGAVSNAQLAASISSTTVSNITISGNLNVDTNVLHVDSIAHEVGINTTTPLANLHVVGNVLISANINASNAVFTGSMRSAGLYDSSNRLLIIKDASGNVVWGN